LKGWNAMDKFHYNLVDDLKIQNNYLKDLLATRTYTLNTRRMEVVDLNKRIETLTKMKDMLWGLVRSKGESLKELDLRFNDLQNKYEALKRRID
jgi:hypothetical protein